MKTNILLAIFVAVLGAVLVKGILYANHLPLTNGDFETGDLSAWTPFTTPNGTLGVDYPRVTLADTDGDGIASYAAQFQVGQIDSVSGQYEGGGLYQNVHLDPGTYAVSTDVAVIDTGSSFGNYSAGRFELILNGNVVDTHEFSFIDSRQTLVASLAIQAEAPYEIRVRITRPNRPSLTLTQVIDNVAVRLVGGGDTPDLIISPSSATPEQAIEDLMAAVHDLGLRDSQERLLTNPLEAAQDAHEAGRDSLALNALNTFVNKVEARSGKIIGESDAEALLSATAAIVHEIQGTH